MANSIEEILGKQINSVKELKAAIKELQDSLIGVDADSEQFKTTTEQLAAAQAELNKVTKAGTQDNVAAKDSLVGMRQEYKTLYDQYKLLTEEQRKSNFGKAMADSLETLSNKINDTQKGIGDFRGNVGRYAQSITDAFNGMGISLGALQTPLKMATGGANAFGKALKSLAANPIVLIITGLVAILAKAAEAIKKNEELTNRLQQAFSVFRPVLDAVANAFDFLAGLLVKTVEGLSKVAEKIMSIIPGMKQAIQSHKELEKATQNLTKATREANIENSKKQAEIERLREEASATEDVVEKKKLLEEAKAIQAEVDQKNIELAQEELRILQEYGEKTANSAEENEKLAAAQKKVNDAIAQGERNQRMYNKQLDATSNKTKAATSSTTDYRKKATELYNQLVEESKTEIVKLTEKYEKEKKLLEKYHLDTTLLTKKYNKDISKLASDAAKTKVEKRKEDMDRELDDEARHYQNMQRLQKNELERELGDLENIQNKLNAVYAEFSELKNNAKFGGLFDTIFQEGKYDMVGSLEYAIKLAPELKTELEALGEDGYDQLSLNLQKLLAQLQNIHGVTIKNIKDFKDNNDILVQQISELKQKLLTNSLDEMQNGYAEQQARNTVEYYKNYLFKLADASNFYEYFGQYETNYWDAEKFQVSALTAEYEALAEQKEIIGKLLDDETLTYEARIQLLTEYMNVLEDMTSRQQALVQLNNERTNQMWDNLISWSDGTATALGTLKGSYESLIESQVKAGQIDEQEAKKKKKRLQKLEEAQTAFNIASIAAEAASGLFSIWKGYATETGVINPQTAAAAGPGAAVALGALNAKSLISAIAKTASLTATAAAQIAAARNGQIASNNNFSAENGGGTGSIGVAATPALIDSTPYSYTRTVQSQEDVDRLNQPIWVSVVDVENALGQQAVVRDESSF